MNDEASKVDRSKYELAMKQRKFILRNHTQLREAVEDAVALLDGAAVASDRDMAVVMLMTALEATSPDKWDDKDCGCKQHKH